MRILPTPIFATLVLLAGLFIAQPAFAYKFNFQGQCPNGAVWAQERLPLAYYINEDGSDDLPIQSVEQIVDRAFSTWEAPCCSAFSATYAGQTSLGARNITDKVVLSFEEDAWPSQLGSPTKTIGVTLIQLNTNCTVHKAPILFNGVNFTFCEGGNGCTDLESIAAHEIGHNLGLDHSSNTDATMFKTYEDGAEMRTLTQDDIDGVCALYPKDGCACTQTSDCAPSQQCTGAGQCETAACDNDNDCAAWEKCELSSGICTLPSCQSDNDCDWGYQCNTHNRCVSSCVTCRRCSTHGECGADGVCVDGACQSPCDASDSCPGDAVCVEIGTSSWLASSGSCSNTETCDPGEQCFPDGEGGGICAVSCSSNSHCESGQRCEGIGQKFCINVLKHCINPNFSSRGICPPSYVCESGEPDPCLSVTCPDGQVCQGAGQCVDLPQPDAGTPTQDSGTPEDIGGPGPSQDIVEAQPDAADDPANPDNDKNLDPVEDGPQHIFIKAEGCACSSTPGRQDLPGSLVLLSAACLGLLSRRRP